MSGNSGKMSGSDAARIQSSEAKSGNDAGFAARAQSAGDRNDNAASGGKGGNAGGSSGGSGGGSKGSGGGKK
ncbi:hypothetical protein LTR56_009493 [Elasticomyces elasticus]|nr:hypothetical protein LTR22_021491 [Elasticomyces elasticus]KAK3644828.1 hypothetical protein LTR56_009493 [Elasticomyces elasticus]KAK4930988.1 hypothetical protein LTR49_002403 [Elasticomyces elasticus]KAK5742549.1 hypothetical protein LTS12_024222 [Elasticomyces elasticus]